jgi:hypothetical protein
MPKLSSIPKKINYKLSSYVATHSVGAYFTRDCDILESKHLEVREAQGKPEDKDNLPIEKVKLINNNTVIINDEHAYHIDSSFLADIIINKSSCSNGEIAGPFVFCKYGNKYGLVRVGSVVYNDAISSEKRKSLPKIKSKDFKIGGIYSTPGGKRAVYLGNFNTYSSGYAGSDKKIINNKLFYQFYSHETTNLVNFDFDNYTTYRFEFKTTHSFVENVGETEIPGNFIQDLKDSAKKKIKEKIADWSKYASANTMQRNIEWEYMRYSPLINLHKKEDKDFQKFDINKYLLLA